LLLRKDRIERGLRESSYNRCEQMITGRILGSNSTSRIWAKRHREIKIANAAHARLSQKEGILLDELLSIRRGGIREKHSATFRQEKIRQRVSKSQKTRAFIFLRGSGPKEAFTSMEGLTEGDSFLDYRNSSRERKKGAAFFEGGGVFRGKVGRGPSSS